MYILNVNIKVWVFFGRLWIVYLVIFYKYILFLKGLLISISFRGWDRMIWNVLFGLGISSLRIFSMIYFWFFFLVNLIFY